MEASDVYFENGRRYLRIGTPPLEYLQRHFKPTEYGPNGKWYTWILRRSWV